MYVLQPLIIQHSCFCFHWEVKQFIILPYVCTFYGREVQLKFTDTELKIRVGP